MRDTPEEFHSAVSESCNKLASYSSDFIKDLLGQGEMASLLPIISGLALMRNKMWIYNHTLIGKYDDNSSFCLLFTNFVEDFALWSQRKTNKPREGPCLNATISQILSKTENFGAHDHSRGSALCSSSLKSRTLEGNHVITCEGPQSQAVCLEAACGCGPSRVKII